MEKAKLKIVWMRYIRIAIKAFLIFWLLYFIIRQFTE